MMALGALFALVASHGDAACLELPTSGGKSALDTSEAAVYRAVGDDEWTAGNIRSARSAYREALRRDPRDVTVRERLKELCRVDRGAPHAQAVATSTQDHFQDGLRLMQSGDRAGAITAFEAARAQEADPAAALLEGICEFELRHDQRARWLLDQARDTAGIGATALFFLGLIALHDDEGARASYFFTLAASTDERMAAPAEALNRLTRRDGRLVLSTLVEAGFDSNVELTPDGTATGAGTSDGYAAGIGRLFFRPFGTSGPYAHLTAQYRKQLRIESYDLGGVGGAVGFRIGRDGQYVASEYGYDFVALAGASYLAAHRILGTARLAHESFSILASYLARLESFLVDATGGYSGLRHEARVESDCQLGRAVAIGLGYQLGRDSTSDASFAYWEHGPLANLRWGLGGTVRLLAEARFTIRKYDDVDPDLGVRRSDRYVDGSAAGEMDVSDSWTVRLVGTARRALSNLGDFQYTKLTVAAGLVYTIGVLR